MLYSKFVVMYFLFPSMINLVGEESVMCVLLGILVLYKPAL